MFMLLPDEESLKLEQEIRNLLPKEILAVATLKDILRKGLAHFEELISELPNHQREATMSLYLQKIRKVAFEFHLAVLKMNAKNNYPRFASREDMQARLKTYQEDLQKVARLYQFL
jgi:hypothetical protein